MTSRAVSERRKSFDFNFSAVLCEETQKRASNDETKKQQDKKIPEATRNGLIQKTVFASETVYLVT